VDDVAISRLQSSSGITGDCRAKGSQCPQVEPRTRNLPLSSTGFHLDGQVNGRERVLCGSLARISASSPLENAAPANRATLSCQDLLREESFSGLQEGSNLWDPRFYRRRIIDHKISIVSFLSGFIQLAKQSAGILAHQFRLHKVLIEENPNTAVPARTKSLGSQKGGHSVKSGIVEAICAGIPVTLSPHERRLIQGLPSSSHPVLDQLPQRVFTHNRIPSASTFCLKGKTA